MRSFDPPKAVAWKDTVRLQVLQAGPPPALLPGPVGLVLVFLLPRPGSLPRRVRYPMKKPDLDNLVKGVKDAIRGVIYRDDAVVVDTLARKRFAGEAEHPGVTIYVGPPILHLETPWAEEGGGSPAKRHEEEAALLDLGVR